MPISLATGPSPGDGAEPPTPLTFLRMSLDALDGVLRVRFLLGDELTSRRPPCSRGRPTTRWRSPPPTGAAMPARMARRRPLGSLGTPRPGARAPGDATARRRGVATFRFSPLVIMCVLLDALSMYQPPISRRATADARGELLQLLSATQRVREEAAVGKRRFSAGMARAEPTRRHIPGVPCRTTSRRRRRTPPRGRRRRRATSRSRPSRGWRTRTRTAGTCSRGARGTSTGSCACRAGARAGCRSRRGSRSSRARPRRTR